MRNDQVGMIPHRENPYTRHNPGTVGPAIVIPEPVLTMADVDYMVREKLDQAARKARENTRREAERAWEEGFHRGRLAGREAEHGVFACEVMEVVRGNLNHVARQLHARADDPKTTIASEREYIANAAVAVDRAISRLQKLASTEGDRP